jgi:hypothetical protein
MSGGAVQFACYAYPPNALGYCGPGDPAALLGYASAGVTDRGLVELASQFAGAWPYLRLIAAVSHRPDPLDAAVVEAYWVGNRLLDRVPGELFAAHLRDRFQDRAGPGFADLATLAVSGGVPHHNFHVFAVYPWVGLLRAGRAEEPLRVLDSCRVAWGRVLAVHNGLAFVECSPLCWDGHRLYLGLPAVRLCTVVQQVHVGDTVSVHWDWICEVLSPRRVARLRRYTMRLLDLVNHALARPVAAAVLD